MLPREAEYYRPTRARELRKKKELLSCWKKRADGAFGMGSISSFIGTVLLAALCPYLAAFQVVECSLILFLILVGLVSIIAPIRINNLEKEAQELEKEHHTRYGSLPAAGEKDEHRPT